MKNNVMLVLCILLCNFTSTAQAQLLWGDMGDGTYRNPVLNADYSDPDVVRMGDKYYMVASDFHYLGMQVLESDDLVNWRIVSQIYDRFDYPGWDNNSRYAGGSWAPSIRLHDGRLWVFFCTPHEGLFMSVADSPHGPWSPLHCVKRVEKWEDPCPLWDDDGNAYLGHSLHGAGPIIVHRMSADGKRLLDEGTTVYTGPVAEGTKWLKRKGRYYLVIPEGGVGEGWQTVLRADNIYGPYERRVVLEQGTTAVNGPHQGALIDTPQGEWWFVHFQSTSPLGRVVHLQPARWTDDDWVTMGEDYDGNGVGEPVAQHAKPVTRTVTSRTLPQTDDDFDGTQLHWRGQKLSALALQWQWCHNPVDSMWSLDERRGWLTLHAMPARSLRTSRNMLTQKVMGYEAVATTLMDCTALADSTVAGLLCMGKSFRGIGASRRGVFVECDGRREIIDSIYTNKVWLRVCMDNKTNSHCFFYSTDGTHFLPAGEPFAMSNGFWKGLRVGLFCYEASGTTPVKPQPQPKEAGGRAMFDCFRYLTR